MGDVVDIRDKRFEKTNAGKVVALCNVLDAEFIRLIMDERVPPSDILPALCQRIGVYLSWTDSDREDIVKRLSKIIYKHSKSG